MTWFFVDIVSVEDEVKTKVNDFSIRFNEMSINTRLALENRDVTPKQVIFFLTRPTADLETQDEHLKFVDTLKEAADILDLFIALNEYWNHFNYHLLECLITAPGIDNYVGKEKCVQLKEMMEQYTKDMGVFRQQATLGAYCKIFAKQKQEVPKNFKELVTEHKWTKMNTLQDVEDFRQEVARKYQLHQCLVFFRNILFCSVKVIWWIPIVTSVPSIGPQLCIKEHVSTEGV